MKLRTIFYLCASFLFLTESWGQTWDFSRSYFDLGYPYPAGDMSATLDGDGVLTINSTGNSEGMPDFNLSSNPTPPWQDVRSNILSAVIGNKVTTIGTYTFQDCPNLTSISISNSVSSIGGLSGGTIISSCNQLTDITVAWAIPIPIGTGTFGTINKSMITLHVPVGTKALYETATGWKDFVHIIEDVALNEKQTWFLSSTMTATLDNKGVLTIMTTREKEIMPSYSEYNLNYYNRTPWFGVRSYILSAVIENGVESIGSYAFMNYPNLTSVLMSNTVTTIGQEAFSGCSRLNSASIPNSVITIGRSAFDGCTNLTSISIPNSVTTIGSSAFSGCHLTSLEIANSVTTIGSSAFNCLNLTNVTVNWATPLVISSSSSIFFQVSACTLHVPVGTQALYKTSEVWKDFGKIVEQGADENEYENRLTIDARNPIAGVRTIVVKREGGQDEFGSLDSRKIINGISNSPEIYTLKPYNGGLIAVGINIINNDNLVIPLGLATNYTGEITLSFKGMDSYNAKLGFIDTEANKEIDLTGLASYDYVINYTPKTVNGEAVACEDRFFIRISKGYAWVGNASSDWNDPRNWEGGIVPTTAYSFTVPGNSPNFPVLTNPITVAEIRFEPGAQIGNQHYLTGKALVQYDLRRRESWNMLSVPLKQIYPGDFTFGGYPQTWVQTFTTTTEGNVTKGSWVTLSQAATPFSFGDGFLLWLNADNDSGEPQNSNKGLKLLNNIRELPFFQHHAQDSPDRDLYNSVHQSHDYSTTERKSTFFNVEYQNGQYVRGNISYNVNRNEDAYQLAGESFSKVLNFADGSFALAGNPYMAALDFSKLYNQNSGVINDAYHVWTNAGYESYSCFLGAAFGIIGAVEQNEFIAPLQGFIVEKSTKASSNSMLFHENMTTVKPNSKLRSSSANNENRLTIDARNPTAGVRTLIAKREGGQTEFGNSDSRKIINGITDVPEIYTLKPYNGGLIAVGVNVINSDNLLIPVGLATSYTGNITLTFNGMDSYNAKLVFVDTEANKEIDLTGLISYDYVVNYVPKKINNEAAICENRFYIRISRSTTGLPETAAEKVNVYETNGFIQVVSCTSNPIKEVSVYNLQGALLYKESGIHAISHTINRKLPAGAYIVKAVSEKNVEAVKVVKR